MKMEFPKIVKDIEKKKKCIVTGTPLVSIISNDVQEESGNTCKEYTIFMTTKLKNDPFIKAMLTRIQIYIDKNYS